jgi:histidine triad (HIT) family protein
MRRDQAGNGLVVVTLVLNRTYRTLTTWYAVARGIRLLTPSGETKDLQVADCLFCGIAAGDIPAKRVRESPRTISFRDINPQAPTHVLIIPKEHYANFVAVAEAGGGLLEEMAGEAHDVAVAEGIAEPVYRLMFNTGPVDPITCEPDWLPACLPPSP